MSADKVRPLGRTLHPVASVAIVAAIVKSPNFYLLLPLVKAM
jgi:hypothetical protein